MRLKDYKVGLKVRCISKHDGNSYIVNKCGIIVKKRDSDDHLFGIIFDKELPLCHSLNGDCNEGYGWYLPPEKLVLVNINKRII